MCSFHLNLTWQVGVHFRCIFHLNLTWQVGVHFGCIFHLNLMCHFAANHCAIKGCGIDIMRDFKTFYVKIASLSQRI